ncbi:MAG: hypothetical protein DI537_20270 [Stutzerimonas stutzeri]|nr:MAG: hypothetical protein DI537_20270 [Stutzerimonas stutzeri]
MNLEELLRERCAKGELNYLSIAFTEHGFEVAYRGTKKWEGAISRHTDPVCAINKALTGKPGVEPPRPTKTRKAPEPKPAPPKNEFEDLLG